MKFHNLREENNKKNFLSKIDFSIPGKIMCRSSNFYKSFQNFRFLFCFEKIFLDLYDKTIKEIGIENTKKLCHELGIEVGHCFYCALKLKASKDQSLIFLKNSLKFLKEIGLVEIDKIIQRKNSLIFQGRNSSFQRKNKDISFVSGFLVGILNCFYLKEMELGFSILEEKIFLFEIMQKDLVFDDIKNKKDLFLFHEKEKNFLNWENYEIKKYCSFLDLLKFKKINFHSEINRWKFKHEIILPLEPQSFKLIFEKYHLINKNSFLQNCYYESSKSVFYDLLEKEISLQKRISFFRNIFSSFGWGLPIINFSLNEIHIKFIKNPFFKNDLSCVAGMLTGILEIIFGSRLKLKFIEKSTIIYEKI